MSRSLEAEQYILGALLVDAEAARPAIEHLELDHFTSDAHQAIWKAVLACFDENLMIDPLSVMDAIEKLSGAPIDLGMDYLFQLSEQAPTINTGFLRQYWKILDDHRTRRRVVQAAESLLRSAREITNVDELMNEAQSQLNSLSQNVNAETITINQAMDSMLARIEHLRNLKEGEMIGRTTGVDALDELTMGRQAGLHIIAGRPAMGKTVLGMQAVDKMALDGFASLVISLEMPTDQLVTRSVSAIASLDMQKLKDPRTMTDDDNMKLAAGVTRLSNLPIEYMDKMETNIHKVCQSIRAWYRRTKNHGCVLIDYLQLMVTDPKNANAEVSAITRRLKMLSNELNIPILLISQLNRALENRANKRPINADLRDSGSVEQDADTITFVYRDEIYDENTKFKGVAELIVGKQRNGPIGVVYASSELRYQRFGNLIDYQVPEDEPVKLRKF